MEYTVNTYFNGIHWDSSYTDNMKEAEDQAFEQEARMNSIQNTIMNNQMALAGGVDTSLLGG